MSLANSPAERHYSRRPSKLKGTGRRLDLSHLLSGGSLLAARVTGLKETDMIQPRGRQLLTALVLVLALAGTAAGQEGKAVDQSTKPMERGSRIYIAAIEAGFDTFLSSAIVKKQVPVVVTTDRTKADYEITGIASTEKAGWAKMLFMGTDNSNDLASIKVVDLKSSEVVYGYAVRKGNSYRGKQSAAEACAKHLKEKMTVK